MVRGRTSWGHGKADGDWIAAVDRTLDSESSGAFELTVAVALHVTIGRGDFIEDKATEIGSWRVIFSVLHPAKGFDRKADARPPLRCNDANWQCPSYQEGCRHWLGATVSFATS